MFSLFRAFGLDADDLRTIGTIVVACFVVVLLLVILAGGLGLAVNVFGAARGF